MSVFFKFFECYQISGHAFPKDENNSWSCEQVNKQTQIVE